MTTRSIVHGAVAGSEDGIATALTGLLGAVNAATTFATASTVILKPNYVIDEHWTKGNVTCPHVLDAMIDHALKANPNISLAIGEGGFTRLTGKAFKINGLPGLCAKHGIDLIDFNAAETVSVTIPGATRLTGTIKIARQAVEADLVIPVAALKTHSLATTTLTLKNFMGTLSRKSIMHAGIHEKIVDLYSFFRPKAPFGVIDGFVGSDGYECGGSPVSHGVLLASRDLVALDATGSRLMLQPVEDCEYLRVAHERGFGNMDEDTIDVKDIDVASHARPYAPG